jgi:hypothetical protein
VILEEAKQMPISPFRRDSKFVEVDATILRFDERGIADPLIGSVHDPFIRVPAHTVSRGSRSQSPEL